MFKVACNQKRLSMHAFASKQGEVIDRSANIVHLTALESNVGEEMDPRFTSRKCWQVHLPPQAAGNHGAVGDNRSH